MTRCLITRKGPLSFPAYIPITTFGEKYPLDKLIQPYLPRLAPAVMVSHHYAKQMLGEHSLRIPLMVDSGGFAALFEGACIEEEQGLGVIKFYQSQGKSESKSEGEGESKAQEVFHPREVLEFQELIADVSFTLDFPIPVGLDIGLGVLRQRLTIANAHYALKNRRRRTMPLFACVQGWDVDSFVACAASYVGCGFDGLAIGGLVPRARDKELILRIVQGVRAVMGPELPLHVFGIGNPAFIQELFAVGVDSVDSSSYVKAAARGESWSNPGVTIVDPSPTERLKLALCNLAVASARTVPLSVSPLFH